MIQLLIIADDFTGALDTGVQFAMHGVCTRVYTHQAYDLSCASEGVKVAVVDAETRHLSPSQAYDVVYRLVCRAKEIGIAYIYKKTDSALRGNIGAELSALLEASGCRQLPFLPALPLMNRITIGGVHYIAGVPVSESFFGIEPLEPVKRSDVAEIIAEQTNVPVSKSPALHEKAQLPDNAGIVVFDAESEEDLRAAGKLLADANGLSVMAGCAGFGAVLPELLHLSNGSMNQLPKLDERLLVLCGSVNPITVGQLNYAEQQGFLRLRMQPEQKLTEGYFTTEDGQKYMDVIRNALSENKYVIIDANDSDNNETTAAYAREHHLTIEDLRVQISRALGDVMEQLFDCPNVGTLLITGGDTLLQCMNRVKVYEMEPFGEITPGVVLSRFTLNGHTRFIISKSGGFGKNTLLCDIKKQIRKSEDEMQ